MSAWRIAAGSICASALLIGCMTDGSAATQPTAASGLPAGTAACSFGAFVQEDDPAGLNLRSTPSTAGKILGTLPPSFEDPANAGFKVRIEVDVHGSDDGWFHVDNARDNAQLTGKPARPALREAGWVSGRKLTVKSQATTGRAMPDGKSAAWLSLRDGGGFDNDAMVGAGQLIACRGSWALVEFNEAQLPADVREQLVVAPAARAGASAGRFRAWLNRICGVQETTCDGSTDEH